MRPFDLKTALDGAPVQTRDGREVTQLTRFNVTSSCPLVGVIEGEFFRWMLDGSFPQSLDDSRINLVMAPVKNTGWIARYEYRHSSGYYVDGIVYGSKEDVKAGEPNASSYHRIEWEE